MIFNSMLMYLTELSESLRQFLKHLLLVLYIYIHIYTEREKESEHCVPGCVLDSAGGGDPRW